MMRIAASGGKQARFPNVNWLPGSELTRNTRSIPYQKFGRDAQPCGPVTLVTHGRVEMWRGFCRSNISVSAPFVWRCLSGSTVAPFPHPLIEPDVQISRIRLSDKTSRLCLACDAFCSS